MGVGVGTTVLLMGDLHKIVYQYCFYLRKEVLSFGSCCKVNYEFIRPFVTTGKIALEKSNLLKPSQGVPTVWSRESDTSLWRGFQGACSMWA